VYTATYKAGRGFTSTDWWGAVTRAMGGADRTQADFIEKYIDGREAYPWSSMLPLAGFRLRADSIREPRIGVYTTADSSGGVVVSEVEPAGAAAEAGVRPGDKLVQIGDIPVNDVSFGARFRQRYGREEGEAVPVSIRRDGQPMTLSMKVRVSIRVDYSVVADPNASPKAMRIRKGILTGVTDR
jgi:predicted metalloprotease with PDZ domain